jgi:HEAT repeat protein
MERDPENRLAFVVALGTMGPCSGSAPSALLAALDDPSPGIRQKVFMALSHFARGIDRAIPVLLSDVGLEEGRTPASSRDHDTSPYFVAARAMNPSPAVMPALVEALASDQRHVRGLAAVLLGRIGPDARPVAPALIDGMRKAIASSEGSIRSGDPLVFDFAPAVANVATLEDSLPILGEALRSESFWAKSAAGSVLATLGPRAHEALPALVLAMKRAKEADAKRDPLGAGYAVAIAAALGQIAPQAPLTESATVEVVAALSDGLAFQNPGIRKECAAALGNLVPRPN